MEKLQTKANTILSNKMKFYLSVSVNRTVYEIALILSIFGITFIALRFMMRLPSLINVGYILLGCSIPFWIIFIMKSLITLNKLYTSITAENIKVIPTFRLNASCYAFTYEQDKLEAFNQFMYDTSKDSIRLKESLDVLDPFKENNSGIGLMKQGNLMKKLETMDSQISDMIYQHSNIRMEIEKVLLIRALSMVMIDGIYYYCFIDYNGKRYDIKAKALFKDLVKES